MSDRPPFDVKVARRLTGTRVLVGVTFRQSDGVSRLQHQYHGVVASAGDGGLAVVLDGDCSGSTLRLPPDLRSFVRASPGTYRLRATGEVVENPDFICDWVVELSERDDGLSDAEIVNKMLG
jgi:hypothetical protein